MGKNTVRIYYDADDRGLKRGTRSAEADLARLNKAGTRAFTGLAKGAGIATVAVGGVAVMLGGKAVKAALDAERSSKRMETQLKALNLSYKAHGKHIDEVIQKHSKLSGFDDEDLQDSFTALVRVTGDVNTALDRTGLAADIARGKGISLEAATQIVTKAQLGQVGSLKRQGIEIAAVTTAQDKLKESSGKATLEQVKAAKAADLAATKQAAYAALQSKFGGQAEAYGKTTSGAVDRFKVAWENFLERLGTRILPGLARLAEWATKHLPVLERWGEALGKKIQPRLEALAAWAREHKEDFVRVFDAARAAAERIVGILGTVIEKFGGWQKAAEAVFAVFVATQFVAAVANIQKAAAAMLLLDAATLRMKARRVGIIVGVSLVIVEGAAIWNLLKRAATAIGGPSAGVHLSLPQARGTIADLLGIGGNPERGGGAPAGAQEDRPSRKDLPSAPIGGRAGGGVVPGRFGDGDRVPALLAGGEVILNPSQQAMVGPSRITRALQATGAPMGVAEWFASFAKGGAAAGFKPPAQKPKEKPAVYKARVADAKEAFVERKRESLVAQTEAKVAAAQRKESLFERGTARRESDRQRSPQRLGLDLRLGADPMGGVKQAKAEVTARIEDVRKQIALKRRQREALLAASRKARAQGFPGLAVSYAQQARDVAEDIKDAESGIKDLAVARAGIQLELDFSGSLAWQGPPESAAPGDVGGADFGGGGDFSTGTGSVSGGDFSTGTGSVSGGDFSTGTGSVSGGVDPDVRAQLERAELRARVAQRAAALSGAFVSSLGLTGNALGGITVQALFPPPPDWIAKLAEYAAQGFGAQGFQPATRESLGV